MNFMRMLAVSKNIFKRLRHDRRTIGMIVLMPIIFMVLFGFTFAGEPKEVPVIVVNLDEGITMNTTTASTINTVTNPSISFSLFYGRHDKMGAAQPHDGDLGPRFDFVAAVAFGPPLFLTHPHAACVREVVDLL